MTFNGLVDVLERANRETRRHSDDLTRAQQREQKAMEDVIRECPTGTMVSLCRACMKFYVTDVMSCVMCSCGRSMNIIVRKEKTELETWRDRALAAEQRVTQLGKELELANKTYYDIEMAVQKRLGKVK